MKSTFQFFFIFLIGCYSTLAAAEEGCKPAVQIIYINGPSSAGKSTLAKALQESLDQPFLHIGIDKMIDLMPAKVNNWQGGYAPLGFSWESKTDESGHPVQELKMGPFAQKILPTYREVVLALAKLNHFIIIDDVANGKEGVDEWREALKGYQVLWVGINVPLSVLEMREKQRGDRVVGQARGCYHLVHKDVVYDLEFDTSQEPLEKVVQAIKQKVCR